jgi:AcrR family transcriptional regulator
MFMAESPVLLHHFQNSGTIQTCIARALYDTDLYHVKGQIAMKGNDTPKNKLFQTAARLFYQHGYRAIGVDTIAAESGIGKMTLYRHYPSKDALIVAYLKDSDEVFWRSFDALTKDEADPRDKLLAFFQGLQGYATSSACYGCPFLNIATEYPEPDYPGHQIALAHKQSVRARFRALAGEAGARQPEKLADSLFMLMDGAYMAARMFGASPHNPAGSLTETVRQLLDAHCAA